MNNLKKTIMLSFTIMSAVAGAETISLKGDWNFKLDPDNVGLKEQWFKQQLPDKAKLPGSLDEQKLGIKNDAKEIGKLTREYKYIGPAWYQKKVTIPEKWDNKRIVLFLERAMWETHVYVDGVYIETQNSLSVPH
ncbi:glycoside hydrolase family 2, partial [bacterium]|nr:glycoside hydrolase family 2 [bacterium]